MARALGALLAVLLLGGCYTTTTRVLDAGQPWPALPGSYDVTITRPGQEAEHKQWIFEGPEGTPPAYRFAGVGPEPAETLVMPLAGEVRLMQVADGRGKYLLMLARPTASGFEVLLHEDVPAMAAAHDVEAVPLETGYQLNGAAPAIRALLAEIATRPARVLATAVREP